jgi:hypothetical protein
MKASAAATDVTSSKSCAVETSTAMEAAATATSSWASHCLTHCGKQNYTN